LSQVGQRAGQQPASSPKRFTFAAAAAMAGAGVPLCLEAQWGAYLPGFAGIAEAGVRCEKFRRLRPGDRLFPPFAGLLRRKSGSILPVISPKSKNFPIPGKATRAMRFLKA
jgi:hypothetical protein